MKWMENNPNEFSTLCELECTICIILDIFIVYLIETNVIWLSEALVHWKHIYERSIAYSDTGRSWRSLNYTYIVNSNSELSICLFSCVAYVGMPKAHQYIPLNACDVIRKYFKQCHIRRQVFLFNFKKEKIRQFQLN